MGFGKIYKYFLKEKYYLNIPFGLLLANWFYQRILNLNNEVPFSVHFTSKIKGFKLMKIDESVKISFTSSPSLYMVCFSGGRLEIGENTIIAPHVVINNGNHGLLDRNEHSVKNIVIGKNCWLGANCILLGGAELGDNVTVGAGSLVNKSFPSNVVIGGVPAKIIKKVVI